MATKMQKNETAEVKVNETSMVVVKKLELLKAIIEEIKINGIQFLDINDNTKCLRSNLLIEGQTLPLFIVLNNSIYSYIQVHLITVAPEKVNKCLAYLNDLNERFSMLKYSVSQTGNVILTCSVPSSEDHFQPELLIVLLDQIILHLQNTYSELMKKIWEE